MQAVIIHGGAYDRPVTNLEAHKSGVHRACEAAIKALSGGGSALDAVEQALWVLEDDPLFDAGTGSYLTLVGEVEMDACLMSSAGEAGAVACIRQVQHPISVARKVMEETPHVLLVGEGAETFARLMGFPSYDPATPEAREEHTRELASLSGDLEDLLGEYRKLRSAETSFSTVGAVVLDDRGLIAAGTTTGGIRRKLPGRVGDSPIIGAGTYACLDGGASATGAGEGILKMGLTRAVVEKVATGVSPQEAVNALIEAATQKGVGCGVIALGPDGSVGSAHNRLAMPCAYWRAGEDITTKA